ncbi:MAG: hypothetical protein IPI72_09050 [Flavobacteriales bacterium]|nr:hypothetical protein [Flavobacteriales bacterium]
MMRTYKHLLTFAVIVVLGFCAGSGAVAQTVLDGAYIQGTHQDQASGAVHAHP